ncbi:hypothetical protein GH714_037660 [Hevea brasiliensis]|uniref:R13L1/DRL21-like LRR repeat region domain-containing protein n=1 Tax=Hevea brasiliensis TaxID=3981 RepID=A0A6A6L4Q1_HEVBR|nr:hypothetical protein GH714_037660 [Hevea brasiliensis]
MMKIPSDGDSFSVFDNLVEVRLHGCKWCEELPKLAHLCRLKVLLMHGMDRIRCIGNEFYGIDDGSTSNGVRPFPALKDLYFGSMKSLVEWKAPPVDEGGETVVFSCLEISIGGCSKLTCLPNGPNSFTSLETLNIFRCEALTSVPEYLSELHSLTRLEIIVSKYEFFSGENIRRLHPIEVFKHRWFSEELDSFPYLNSIQDLPSLEILYIFGDIGGRIKSLPDHLQHLTALNSLTIVHFNGIEVLPEWFGNLSPLKSLTLWDCENLKYLPTATAMQRLYNLTKLRIFGCPFLWGKCAKGSGSEWSKISHLPNKYT